MGPSVKFVSCINGSFSKKKIMGHFFIRKKRNRGGEGRGRFGKTPDFYVDLFVKPSLIFSWFAYLLFFSQLNTGKAQLDFLPTLKVGSNQYISKSAHSFCCFACVQIPSRNLGKLLHTFCNSKMFFVFGHKQL